MPFGQVVVGPPGSGKTTYCDGMQQFMQLIGRKVAVINMDPANDFLPYECAINIEDLIRLEDVMEQHGLGPNGGLVYCMDYIDANFDWLQERLKKLLPDHYFLFDFPGQVELFTLHSSARSIIQKLGSTCDIRLAAVHLVDAHLCSEAHKYVAALLVSLEAMLHLELPHINILSKIDLIEKYGKLAFNLDFYTDVNDLSYLQQHLEADPRNKRFSRLTSALCEVVGDFGLVSFETLNIQDKESVARIVQAVDKASGYTYASVDANKMEFSRLTAAPPPFDDQRVGDIQEKYMHSDDEDS